MNWQIVKKIIWQPSGGYWLFYCSAIYFNVAMYSIFVEKFAPIELIQFGWLCIIALPLVCNPLARRLNMKENTMFDFFKKKDPKLVEFPKPKLVDPEPTPAPEKEKPAKIYYRLGLTDNNRVSFNMGYTEITMNKAGCQQMIDQLTFFQSQLYEEEE